MRLTWRHWLFAGAAVIAGLAMGEAGRLGSPDTARSTGVERQSPA